MSFFQYLTVVRPQTSGIIVDLSGFESVLAREVALFIGTHASLPVLGATIVNAVRGRRGRGIFFSRTELLLLAAAGILPDVTWPHLSLQARLNSPTHTVWFLALLLPALLLIYRRWAPSRPRAVPTALWLAVTLHVVVDTVTGGTAPFFPFGERVGFSSIPFRYWALFDLVLVPLAAFCIFRTRPSRSDKDNRRARQESPDGEPTPS